MQKQDFIHLSIRPLKKIRQSRLNQRTSHGFLNHKESRQTDNDRFAGLDVSVIFPRDPETA